MQKRCEVANSNTSNNNNLIGDVVVDSGLLSRVCAYNTDLPVSLRSMKRDADFSFSLRDYG